MEKKNFKTYFDKIFCITYVEAQERRDYIEKQLRELDLLDGLEYSYGMPFAKIKAMRDHFEKMVEESHYPSASIGGVGCAFNHYSAIKIAYESNANSVLIFEDDCLFLKDRDKIIEYLDNIPDNWDYLYFTPSFVVYYDTHDLDIFRTTNKKYINMKDLRHGLLHWNLDYNTPNFWNSTCTYALNRKAMKLYIDIFEMRHRIENSDYMEYFNHNFISSPLTSYTTNIRLFAQPSEIDSIKYDNENNKYLIRESKGKNNGIFISNCLNTTKDNFFEPNNNIKSIINK